MEFHLREAVKGDAGPIADLLNPIIRAGKYSRMDAELSAEDMAGWIRGVSGQGVFNVAVCGESGLVLGFQSVEPVSTSDRALRHVGEISTFVSPASHRQGVGRRLTGVTLEGARKQGFFKIIATVRADNPEAVSFYRDQGFNVIGIARKHALVRGEYLDEVLMEHLMDDSSFDSKWGA